MKNQRYATWKALVVAALFSAAAPRAGLAADGQVAITQARALAGGVTPGDAPGFPVTISQPGSYVLSSNLIVPNANTDAIVIGTSHVTIDLNGFAILGPTDCSGGLDPCAGDGAGSGVRTLGDAYQFNITIRNGTIQGVGARGIDLRGGSDLVEYMHLRSNGLGGIRILVSPDGGGSIVQYNTMQRNGGHVVQGGGGAFEGGALELEAGLARNNVVDTHVFGFHMTHHAGYVGNVFFDNEINIVGGVSLGQNLCGASSSIC